VNNYVLISAVEMPCVNCQENMDKLKSIDFMTLKKSLTSDFSLGIYIAK